MITVFTDGAGWNGVLSECAFVIYCGKECWYESHFMTYNECTNNEMEYKALLLALEHLYQSYITGTTTHIVTKALNRIVIRSDSQLVVNQVTGIWKVNFKHLRNYTEQCKELIEKIEGSLTEIGCPVHLEWTRRNKNRAGKFIELKQKERRKADAKAKRDQ